ncbi:hypothetical protein FE257_003374 [Aspergillus nanangensis]|uniref:Uncharacterized protein n=1 Tax=Aspergillus nanangensis TaxID=2582783 RepID=A0AAD4GNN0_ASPNN|nr:hypothetical protein FE257_003374 [Aspergillus nanangensis]
MSFIDPSAATLTLCLNLLESERNQYEAKPNHQPSKSQVQCFERNCALLKEPPLLLQKPRSTKRRNEKAKANILSMHQKFPSDLLVLLMMQIPKTKLSEFKIEWIDSITEWWTSKLKPKGLSTVALALCQHFNLTYRNRDTTTPTSNIDSNIQFETAIEELNLGLPSDQPIESTVSLEREEFLHVVDSCKPVTDGEIPGQEVDNDIHALGRIIRRAANSSDLKMICPWYGGPSVEVTLKINMSMAFGEQLLRYRLAHAPGLAGLKNQTNGFP